MIDSIFSAKWIKAQTEHELDTVMFKKTATFDKKIKSATLTVTSLGVYEAYVGGKRVGDFILAPAWTDYKHRLQYQTYDITDMLSSELDLCISVGGGWYSSSISHPWPHDPKNTEHLLRPVQLLASVDIVYEDDTKDVIVTDETWQVSKWNVVYSDIYHGETYDACAVTDFMPVALGNARYDILIPTEGEKIVEHEALAPVREIRTPKGERVIDFGQEITGYVAFDVTAKAGERIVIDHAEVLDSDGNFYRDNLRTALVKIEYTCKDGKQSYKPHHTFMGFRYIRLTECPEEIPADAFKAIVVCSELKRTGHFECSNEKVNKLYSNLVWGNRDNFLDVPTDCPQRDERLGWTGDAQVFIKTAAYNFDVQKFFTKWLRDMYVGQSRKGAIPRVIPNVLDEDDVYASNELRCSAAWGDAATVCPWQIYVSYADRELLCEMLPMMERFVSHIHNDGDDPYRWCNGQVYGDWLSMEPTDMSFIADAFYAYSTSLVIKARRVLGLDTAKYDELYRNIVDAFRRNHPTYTSQTECVLALHFKLTTEPEATAAQLARLIHENDDRLTTGFVGTPYLLHALSDNGYADVAYSLLLQEKFPSWLFSVNMGATTIWEHWDSLKEDGTFWSTEMNSFNHYAYGSVGDWLYGVVCGIKPREDKPGYEEFDFAPIADERLDFVNMEYESRYGKIKAGWKRKDGGFEYHLTVPCGTHAHVSLGERNEVLGAGEYIF